MASGSRLREKLAECSSRSLKPVARSRRTLRRFLSLSSADFARLVVVVQIELVRMWPQTKRVDLVLPLVVDPRLDEILGEDVAAREERVILLERVHGLLERAGR